MARVVSAWMSHRNRSARVARWVCAIAAACAVSGVMAEEQAPDPNDWLMISRTVDNQRFSPLKQIGVRNVAGLKLAWTRGIRSGAGSQQTVPVVQEGVMYIAQPSDWLQAVDATSGDLIWEYRRVLPEDLLDISGNFMGLVTRNIALYDNKIFHQTADSHLIALDARTGDVVWDTTVADYRVGTTSSSGPMVFDGIVVSGRTCSRPQECFFAAHDARTGKELWRTHVVPRSGEPGDETWGGLPYDKRSAISLWGIPGGYDPATGLLYYGTANPRIHTRLGRYGDPSAISRASPSELYGNSTLAMELRTGRIAWYFQHLPGDNWDLDHSNERILIDTVVRPDATAVRWINPKVKRESRKRKTVVSIAKAGGLWVLDRESGEFLWADPFPGWRDDWILSELDPTTGKATINWSHVNREWGGTDVMCYHNVKNWWPMAYSPRTNLLYVPWNNLCVEQTAVASSRTGTRRRPVLNPGADPQAVGNLTAIDMSTGKRAWTFATPDATSAGALATAGDVIFWGDLNRRFGAYHARTGKQLWETVLGDSVTGGPLTYAVDGKQYVAVTAGESSVLQWLMPMIKDGSLRDPKVPLGHNAVYVFALP